jgi:hypothetical protein
VTSEEGAIKQVVQSKDDGAAKSETSTAVVVSSANAWKKDSDTDISDALVRLMRDQLIMARAYANIAQGQGHYDLVRDLKLRIKEHTGIVGDANVDAELPAGYFLRPLLFFYAFFLLSRNGCSISTSKALLLIYPTRILQGRRQDEDHE